MSGEIPKLEGKINESLSLCYLLSPRHKSNKLSITPALIANGRSMTKLGVNIPLEEGDDVVVVLFVGLLVVVAVGLPAVVVAVVGLPAVVVVGLPAVVVVVVGLPAVVVVVVAALVVLVVVAAPVVVVVVPGGLSTLRNMTLTGLVFFNQSAPVLPLGKLTPTGVALSITVFVGIGNTGL
jgi:hypothetical protein